VGWGIVYYTLFKIENSICTLYTSPIYIPDIHPRYTSPIYITDTHHRYTMSAQALQELKELQNSLSTLSSTPKVEDSSTLYAQNPSAIISGTHADPNNHWKDYLLIQKLVEDAIVPTKNNHTDAGYDIYSFENSVVPAWGKKIISTQITVGLPLGTYGRVASRSGLSALHDIEVGAGVIDSGYTGELRVVLRNFSDTSYVVARGDKIAQLILEQYKTAPLKVVKKISDLMGYSTRGASGFGSSGK
jgi:dUTP pyrophosphatase